MVVAVEEPVGLLRGLERERAGQGRRLPVRPLGDRLGLFMGSPFMAPALGGDRGLLFLLIWTPIRSSAAWRSAFGRIMSMRAFENSRVPLSVRTLGIHPRSAHTRTVRSVTWSVRAVQLVRATSATASRKRCCMILSSLIIGCLRV